MSLKSFLCFHSARMSCLWKNVGIWYDNDNVICNHHFIKWKLDKLISINVCLSRWIALGMFSITNSKYLLSLKEISLLNLKHWSGILKTPISIIRKTFRYDVSNKAIVILTDWIELRTKVLWRQVGTKNGTAVLIRSFINDMTSL